MAMMKLEQLPCEYQLPRCHGTRTVDADRYLLERLAGDARPVACSECWWYTDISPTKAERDAAQARIGELDGKR